MRNRRWILALIAILLAAALIAAWLRLTPRLLAALPEAGALDVAPDAVLRLEFSQPMDRASVEERLALEPETAGRLEWPDERTLTFTPASPWPRGTTVQATLAAGARSALGLPLTSETSWSFAIRHIQLAYLWPADGPAQLYAIDVERGDVQQLTEGPAVIAFSPAPDGAAIYYAARNAQGGADLYRYERATDESTLLLDCGPALCSDLAAAPDGAWLAYTRQFYDAERLSESVEVWLLAPASGEVRLMSAEGGQARLPGWSPAGALAYYDVEDAAYVVVNAEGEMLARFPNGTGELGTWTPDGSSFIAPELYVQLTDTLQGPIGELANQPDDPANDDRVQVLTSHLLRYPLDGSPAEDLTLANILEDTAPALSPDGGWLAFARRYLDDARFTTGRQVWLMRPDGSDPRMLTNAPSDKHTAFAWHPDGSWLAVVRFNATTFTLPPEILLIHVETGEVLQLVSNAFSPQWLP
ncbi:MAG: hypothetical protein EPO32_10755 [Anaerolineae bacterium]|nr:MAG: hypothetical protein EPO32_10755 [Anaerolineae bacterium]